MLCFVHVCPWTKARIAIARVSRVKSSGQSDLEDKLLPVADTARMTRPLDEHAPKATRKLEISKAHVEVLARRS